MLVWALVSWWFGTGWKRLGGRILWQLRAVVDFFSIILLLKTLFAPYRQLSVGAVRGPLSVQLRAWVDRQISRGIGAMVRLSVIIFGAAVTLIAVIIAVIAMLTWPLVPLLPLITFIITIGAPR